VPVISILPDKRVIAKTRTPPLGIMPTGGAIVSVAISMSDLKAVEEVIAVNFVVMSAKTEVTPSDFKIAGNVVGMTLNAAAGTTLTMEVIAIGF